MLRKPKNYDNEILNLRAFYLRVIMKLPVVLLCAALMGLLFGAVYGATYQLSKKNALYRVDSTLYIYFAYDENAGTLVDHYNAYTWNTIIKTDDVINPVLDEMAGKGYDFTRQEIEDSINADIPSDVRVMIVSTTGKDKDSAKALSDALNKSLEAFGKSNNAFEQIEVLSAGDPILSIKQDRIVTAIIFGIIFGFVMAVFVLLLYASMDDEVYISEDAEIRYHIPVLGMVTPDNKEQPPFLRNEMIGSMDSLLRSIENVAVISVDDKEGKEKAVKGADRIKAVIGSAFDFEKTKLLPMALPGNDDKISTELQIAQGAIILMDMGKENGAMCEHLISMLHKLECPIIGIVITNADAKYIKRYLGL